MRRRRILRVELHVSFPAIGKRAHAHAELMNVITGRTLKLRYRRDAHSSSLSEINMMITVRVEGE